LEVIIDKDVIATYLKNVMQSLKNRINFPRLNRKEVEDTFGFDNPQSVIQECLESEDREAEAAGIVQKLVKLLTKTKSIEHILNCSIELGFEKANVEKFLNLIILTC